MAPVEIQQQNADLKTWTVVGTGAVEADGSFSVPVQLAAGGTYRVSVTRRRLCARGGHPASRGAVSRLALLVVAVAALCVGGAGCCLRSDRPAVREAVVPPGRPCLRRVAGTADDARAGESRGRRLRRRLLAAGLPGPHRRLAQLRRRRPVRRHGGTRNVRGRHHRREPRQPGNRRDRVLLAVARREGREARRDDSPRSRGGGDPLGARTRARA